MRAAVIVLVAFLALSEAKPYDWKKWVSKRGSKSSLSEVSTSDVASSGKGGKGDFDWKKLLSSNSFIPSHVFENAPETQNAYDWKKWLSNSYIPSDVLDSYIPSDVFDSYIPDGDFNFAPKKVRPTRKPKSSSTGSKTGKGGKYDWQKWLSKRKSSSAGTSDNSGSVDVSGSASVSASNGGKGGFDWQKFLSKSGGKGGYDWKKWLSKSKSQSGSDVSDNSAGSSVDVSVPEDSSTGGSASVSGTSGSGGYDWKKWVSNGNSIPSGIQEKYSFSTFDWKSYVPSGFQ